LNSILKKKYVEKNIILKYDEMHFNSNKHMKNVNDIQKIFSFCKNVENIIDDTNMDINEKIKSLT
jgi:hypothetical protein